MRIFIKKAAGWIHTSLIAALIIPMLYALVAEPQDAIARHIYLKCLVIIVPVILTDFAVERCKGLLSYLLASAFILAATGAFGWLSAGWLRQGAVLWLYLVPLLIETMFLIVSRLSSRLSRKKEQEARETADPTWRPSSDILREPSYPALVYFLIVYTAALNLNCPPVCNAALFSAALYALVTLLYEYVCETERYLSLNKRTCNLPSRRIYGIGAGMLAVFILLCMIAILPAFFTISGRHYRDLREWSADIKIDYTAWMPEPEVDNIGEDPMAALMEEYGEARPAPRWLIALSYVMEVAVFVLLAAALLRKIYATFHDFRQATDDNGDLIEELTDIPEKHLHTEKPAPAHRRRLSEREQIRREYRKTIRRHLKDRPAFCETPTEIETRAGIADSVEGIELHRRYEQARYGR